MNFIKTAFANGLQRSLVSSGAMPSYTSHLQMKIAAIVAMRKVADGKEVDEITEDDAGEIMAEMVNGEGNITEETEEAIAALEEYAAQSDEAGEAAVDLAEELPDLANKLAEIVIKRNSSLGDAQKVSQAQLAVEWLKRAADEANTDPKPTADKETEEGARKGEGYANNPPHGPKLDATAADTTDVSKVSQVQSAIDLLRKLAENEANPSPTDPGDKEVENMGPVAANTVTRLDGTGDGSMVVADHGSVAESTSGADNALAMLVQKTAEEVGHFLPPGLAPSDKLAALRTMVGMNGQERAAYIGRIKQAAAAAHTTEAHENAQDRDIAKLLKEQKKNAPDELASVEAKEQEEQEIKAAHILRRLGIGA